MQMDAIANEGFWTRVRTALTRRVDEPAYGQSAISANIGKKRRTTQVVDDELRICWASAATRNVSLCVINVEMDRFAEYYAVYGQDAADDCVARLGDIVSSLRPRETIQCLRSGRCGFTLILPDMPVLVARVLVSKIMAAVKAEGLINKESHTGLVTLGAGLSVINPRGKHDRRILDMANTALRRAQRRGLGQLEVIDLRSTEDRRRKAA